MSDLTTQIAVLETQMKNIAKQVDDGFTKLEHALELNNEQHEEMFVRFEKAMDKKADRWVQNVIVWVGSVIGVAILGALMSLILIK